MSTVDKSIAKNWKETKLFLQKNSELFMTKADKVNVTVISNRSDYNEKILKLLNDNSTYKKINYNPLKLMKKDTYKLLENWRIKNFLGKNVTKKDISINNTILPRIHGLPKMHKKNFPLRSVVSLINTLIYYMSKIIAKILKKSLPSPNSQVKNSFIFKDVISKTKIPTDHIMISLYFTYLFINVPFELVINSIKKRWCFIKSATNFLLQEFQKDIEFLMNNTFY